MKLNHSEKQIIMTQKESKLAGRVGSTQYNEYLNLKALFPEYTLEIVKNKRTTKTPFIRMTLQMMLDYIKAHGDKEVLTKFYSLRGKDENGNDIPFATVHTISEIKIWFFEAFPEIQQPSKKSQDLIDEAKRKRQERLETKTSAESQEAKGEPEEVIEVDILQINENN